MGTSLTTLSLYGAERSSVEPRLAPTDTLRDQNPPWLTVVPDHDEEESYPRLVKLAGALTKEAAAGALVFEYFDDDMFSCLLYRGGKRIASCRNDGSWAKLGKALGELLGDDGPVRSFRYVRHCTSLEEQVALLEETVGAALFDIPEEEPRLVPRSDAVMQAIRSREELLRRRPNAFTLTEVPQEEWPEALQLREALLERLRPQLRKYDLELLLYHMDMEPYLVPGSPGLVAYPYWVRNDGKALLFYDGKTGELWERGPFLNLNRVVRMTGAGEPVILLFQTVTRFTGNGPARFSGMGYACCMREDGTERWRFAPEMDVHQNLQHVHTSDEGVITLFARSLDTPSVQADARVWQIDGETGELLRARRFDLANDPVDEMVYAPSPGVFLCSERKTGELVVLNEQLEETACRDCPIQTLSYMSFSGDELCDCLWDRGIVRYINLRTGQARETKLEVSAGCYFTPLPDGRILGLNEKGNQLTVFDREGLLAARCKVPGMLQCIFPTERGVFLGELRSPDFGGVICGELFAMASTHVWRLDPVLKKLK